MKTCVKCLDEMKDEDFYFYKHRGTYDKTCKICRYLKIKRPITLEELNNKQLKKRLGATEYWNYKINKIFNSKDKL